MTARQALAPTGDWDTVRTELVEVFRAAGRSGPGKVRFDLGYTRVIIDVAG
ncbi:MAG: hypothetical protein ACR2K0_03025 [Acidimicrobiales bacterium]